MTPSDAPTTTTAPTRYPDRRTVTARRPPTSVRRAARRTAAAPPPYPLTGPGPATTVARTRAREDPVTAPGQHDRTDDPAVPTRLVDGHLCTNRAGIAHLAGWTPGNSVNVRARTDPDFPHGTKDGREYWYPFDGPRGVDAYIALLAERATAKKPPPVKDGDPDDELASEDAADALHIAPATLRSYVRYSIPYWQGDKTGRPLLPPPDIEEEREHERLGPYTHRAWYRRTLAAHQATRPGPGTGAGRPRGQ
ncbi:hypothetical protein [Micromonospora sp. NPDC048063]|uniref:hypothetical protein n=1 Tax=Micromonospora sp. NPDC048063 TaxID=3364256 RepID=UPI0037162D7E